MVERSIKLSYWRKGDFKRTGLEFGSIYKDSLVQIRVSICFVNLFQKVKIWDSCPYFREFYF